MNEELTRRAARAIRDAWEEGCPVAGAPEMMAPIAVRRWTSAARRLKHPDNRAERIRDLTRGLIEHCDPHPDLVGRIKTDYQYLAEKIAKVFGEDEV